LGRAVHTLAGRYVIAEDVGTTPADMEVIATQTPYVVGRASGSGDTGPSTAHCVFAALRTDVAQGIARTDLEGLRVAVQGLGTVGSNLCKVLSSAGARLFVADPRESAVRRVVDELGAHPVAVDEVLALDVDVVAPCALGAVLDDLSIPRLRCRVVAGAANNQLRDESRHGRALHDRGVLWAPDFVANMGGVLGAAAGGAADDRAALYARVEEKVAAVMSEVLAEAARRSVSTHEAAVALARAAVKTLRGR
jgi:leucine dehydrogenase